MSRKELEDKVDTAFYYCGKRRHYIRIDSYTTRFKKDLARRQRLLGTCPIGAEKAGKERRINVLQKMHLGNLKMGNNDFST